MQQMPQRQKSFGERFALAFLLCVTLLIPLLPAYNFIASFGGYAHAGESRLLKPIFTRWPLAQPIGAQVFLNLIAGVMILSIIASLLVATAWTYLRKVGK